LRKDDPSPFPVLSDEVQVKPNPDELTPPPPDTEKPKDKEKDKKEAKPATKPAEPVKDAEKPKEFRIDLDGIQGRIVALPMAPSVIRSFLRPRDFFTTRARRFRACLARFPASRRKCTFTI